MPDEPIFVRGHLSPRALELLRRAMAFLFWLFTRIEARGMENVPASGGMILCVNHLSRFDAPLIFTRLPGRRLTAFAADTYRRNPFFRWIVEAVDAVWVRRGAIMPTTIRAAIQALREGRILGVAPEGTRSRTTHALQKGKTGAAFLALEAGVPIVPAAITGAEHLSRNLPRLRRTRLTVTFGQPFTLTGPKDSANLEAQTTEIMCRIAALLPEEYRGVYAGEARVRELMRET